MPLIAAETGQFHTSYKQEVRVYETRYKLVAVLAVAVLAYVVVPSLFSDYWLSVLTLIGIASVAALGLNVLIGYTGLISIGHAAFAAIGGYTAVIVAMAAIAGAAAGAVAVAGRLNVSRGEARSLPDPPAAAPPV